MSLPLAFPSRPRLVAGSALIAAALLLAGCLGEGAAEGAADAPVLDSGASDAGGGADGHVADLAAGDVGGADTTAGVGPPSSYPASCGADGDCGVGRACIEGICLAAPTEDSVTTDPATDQVTGNPPNLSCVGKAIPSPEGPGTVRMWGIVDRFGSGKITKKVQVAVFLAADFHPERCRQDSAAERATCILDQPEPLGETVSIDPDDWPPNAAKVADLENIICAVHVDCPLGYECDEKHGGKCTKQFGIFVLDGLPTNAALVIRSVPTTKVLSMRPAYIHNAVLPADRAASYPDPSDPVPSIRYDPTIVSESQWFLVPNTFGSNIRIKEGNVALGGRIRDCVDPARSPAASFNIANATVGSGNIPTKIGYFNDREDDALPLIDRVSTNILGRYTALDVASGWNKVVASVRVEGKRVSLGSHEIFLIPDALNVISFPGFVPYYAP